MSRSVSIDSNKFETMNSTLCHANKSVINTKNVTAVNDGSNIVCVSCGKDMFLLSHEKCVARYALSRNSNIKRALFTTPVAAKSKNLRATSVVTKSRLSVAKTPKATNKVFSASSLSHDSSQSKTLSNYMKNKIAISRKWQRWFKYQQSFNWSHKSKTAQSLPRRVNLEGDDLLTGSRDSEFRVCLMSRATSTKSWLWHRRLSHLNFGTINQLTSKDLVDGLLKFKYNKDHLCSACEQGKSKKASLPPKLVPSTESKLELLHMDLCGPIRVASINGKKYILMIVDDYSRYTWVIQLVLWIVDSRCSKHMTGNLQLLRNFVEKFMGTVRFENDHFAAITGYGDYVQCNLTICHVYYVEGLRHNLFWVGQFYDGYLEVAFRSNTCYVRNLEGDDLLTEPHQQNLGYGRLSHLNFGTINQLTSKDLVDGLPKFKYNKDHLCSACEQGKSKKASLPPKLVPSTESKLELLHMDLCGPMRVASINGKKYILVIVDDYSRYTWVYFLRTKDEAPDMIINFVNQVQRNLKAQILTIRTDNGTEFKNEKLQAFYIKLGIVHQTSIARTPQQNAIATACFTQNRSIVHTRYNNTPYELIQGRKPNIQYFHVFGSLCYPTNNHDDLGKMKPKADISIFIGYPESSRGFRIYNRRTKKIMETIHVKFYELTYMASECNNLEPGMNFINFQDSSEDSQSIPSKSNLDNLFGPLYEEYYATSSQEVSDNFAANTLDNEHTSSSSLIVIEEDEAPQIVSSSAEQVSIEPNSLVLNENADEIC
ncbi:retrovirus-related pol polyprotein from transposon TNT 1-94 [Tanacetum coccineum]